MIICWLKIDFHIFGVLQVLLLMKNLTVNLSSPDFEPVVSIKINLNHDYMQYIQDLHYLHFSKLLDGQRPPYSHYIWHVIGTIHMVVLDYLMISPNQYILLIWLCYLCHMLPFSFHIIWTYDMILALVKK